MRAISHSIIHRYVITVPYLVIQQKNRKSYFLELKSWNVYLIGYLMFYNLDYKKHIKFM